MGFSGNAFLPFLITLPFKKSGMMRDVSLPAKNIGFPHDLETIFFYLIQTDASGLKEPDRVRRSQEEVVRALQVYTSANYPDVPSKFGELLLRMPELQRVCQVHSIVSQRNGLKIFKTCFLTNCQALQYFLRLC